MPETVAVFGATGKLGAPVASHLKEGGFQVRVVTRDRSKARALFDESFEIAAAPVTDPKALEEVLRGCFAVHLSISPPKIEPRVARLVAAQAKAQGLQRITYVSGTSNFEENAWHPIPRLKLAAERAVRESGVPFTIFCPTAVMENLPLVVRGGRAGVFGKQPHPLHWYAADDFGRMVAAAYRTDEAVGKRLFVHGPEGIRMHDAVRRYCAALHPEIQRVSTLPFWAARLIATLTWNQDMKVAVAATSLYDQVGEGGDPGEANRLLGAPSTTLEAWLERRQASRTPPRG